MTDERLGTAVLSIVARMPRGSGIVFRHYATPPAERKRLARQIARVARRRGLVLVMAGEPVWRADGLHGRHARRGRGYATRPVHTMRERIAAERAGVDAIFVSPVFATRSHVGARGLGRVRFGLLIRGSRLAVIALGGMDARRARSLAGFGIAGWAAIDAWIR